MNEYLSYNPDTGIIKWIKRPFKSKIVVGDEAGTMMVGYKSIKFNGKPYKAHRLAFYFMTGIMPSSNQQVDHINHIKTDNRWCNLRLVDQTGNQRNRSLNKNNVTGKSGVYFSKKDSTYNATIRVKNKRVFLGAFTEKDDAVKAREHAEKLYGFHENHGQRRLNG